MAFDGQLKKDRSAESSPMRGGFGLDSGRGQLVLNKIATANLDDTLKAILGGSRPNREGGVSRDLPAAHPRWPWLYAERISEVSGQGKSLGAVPTVPLGNVPLFNPVFTGYDDYAEWQATVEFTARTYAVLPDAMLGQFLISYYKDADAAGAPTGASSYYPEWWRFTDVEVLPKAQIITCQQGQSAFQTQAGEAALPAIVPPHNTNFVGMPRLTIPEGALKVTTYFMPYSFVLSANSNILRFLGRVNQRAFLGRQPGELLYDSVVVTRFTPGYPDFTVTDDCPFPFTPRLLCHVAFIFLQTTRAIGSAAPNSIAKGAWIAAGHNLMPWHKDRKFYYCTTYSVGTAGDRVPFFLSVPFEFLWKDPDVGPATLM